MRSFALERIQTLKPLDQPALDLPPESAPDSTRAGYGIFSGPATATAVLRFSPERARWIADEIWHPAQTGRRLPTGAYELSVPYSDPTELILDILRYGPDVEVLAPEELRTGVVERLRQAVEQYSKDPGEGG